MKKKLQGIEVGSTFIHVYFNGISEQLEVEVVDGVCGGEVNDTNQEAAKGACVKVIRSLAVAGGPLASDSDKKLKLFTSTPTVGFLQILGYQEDNSEENDGLTYARSYQIGKDELADEDVELSPRDTRFALFRQDGKNWDSDYLSDNYGANGQFDRYCQHLSEIEFLGMNWSRPTSQELQDLYHEYHAHYGYEEEAEAEKVGVFWNLMGFPSTYVYWTSTPSSANFIRVGLLRAKTYGTAPQVAVAASCVGN